MKKTLLGMSVLFLIFAIGATASLTSNTGPIGKKTTGRPQMVDVQALIDQGKGFLQAHDILAARDSFSQAVAAAPDNQEANLLYGVTRVFAVVEDGQSLNTGDLDSVREIFELSGVSFTSFNIYGSKYTKPDRFADTTPRTGNVLNFLKSKALPEIEGAIVNLGVVTDPAFTSVLAPSTIAKTSGADISVDYADVLVIKALFNAAKCNLNLLMVYNLDVSIPDIQSSPEKLVVYKKLLKNGSFLSVQEQERLTTAKDALISFIDTYNAAVPVLLARTSPTNHLFVVDVPVTNEPFPTTTGQLNKIASTLQEIKEALKGPYTFNAGGWLKDRTVDLTKLFNAADPINLRSNLISCSSGALFTDPTLNGLLPQGITRLRHVGGYLHSIACVGRETPFITIFRPSEGNWYILNNNASMKPVVTFGASGDIPVPGDYDGDGEADIAVWRNGTWFIKGSTAGTQTVVSYGAGGDIPVPGDYDSDGRTDIAVFRPTDGNWYITNSSNGSQIVRNYGTSGDTPVPGDYDGDGKTDMAVWRNGSWFIMKSSDGSQIVRNYGTSGDTPVPGDYDGDGKTDIAVWRSGSWFVMNSSNDSQSVMSYGTTDDIPVPGYYDADEKCDIAVWRPSEGNWYVVKSFDNSQSVFNWGVSQDKPIK
jgi:hypothetical protein